MMGFFVAAASLAGLFVLGARRRQRYFRGGGLYRVLSRLEASPGQEKVIRSAVEDLRQRTRAIWASSREARPELAELIRAERLDSNALDSWFEARFAALRDMQRGIQQRLAEIHDVLDERQRKELAHLVERTPRWGWHGGSGARC